MIVDAKTVPPAQAAYGRVGYWEATFLPPPSYFLWGLCLATCRLPAGS